MGRFLNLFMLITFAIRDGELLRQHHPRTWLFHQGLYRRRNNQSCQPHWSGWFKHDAERDPRGIVQDRAVHVESLMNPYYAIVYFVIQFLLATCWPRSYAPSWPMEQCGSDHRPPRSDLHPVSCLRQAGVAVLGMAQGISRVLLLQGGRRSHPEHSVTCAHELLHPTGQASPTRQHGADVSVSDPAGTGQHLHPLQDSGHDHQHIHWMVLAATAAEWAWR